MSRSTDLRSENEKSRRLVAWISWVGAVIALGFLAADVLRMW
jgi:hypothetical protein